MNNVFAHFEHIIKSEVQSLDMFAKNNIDFSAVKLEVPKDDSHGDFSTNAAMVLSKQVGIPPRDLAAEIIRPLGSLPDISDISIADPGFINLTLRPEFWTSHLSDILSLSTDYGRGESRGSSVNVEYVSANPTGPMHVGHCRGAVVGDALANLLSFAGYDVVREYYVNDAGGQIDTLAHSLHWRYCEALGRTTGTMPDDLYPGDYLIPPAKSLIEEHGDKFVDAPDWLPIFRDASVTAMMSLIRDDLSTLDIRHDIFFSEASLHDTSDGESAITTTIADLRNKGLVYEGILPPPKGGKVIDDYEPREQLLFKATDVGDDTDRPLCKSNGDYTYFAADIAYFKDKFDRGFHEMVYILGADHGGYLKRMQALARAIAGDDAKLTIRLCQLVKLFRDGAPIKMSKRSGEFITLRDVVDEVGKDAVRFMMLYRKNDAPLDFDFVKVLDQSRDNPVFYVQYAHARCHSVFRQAESLSLDLSTYDLSLLTDSGELALIRKLSFFPRLIEQGALSHEPHRLAFYLYDLASLLHSHWNRGQSDSSLRFINTSESMLTSSRIMLLRAISTTLSLGLGIIGADAPQEMR